MTAYVRRPSPLEVYHYQRQPREEWPQWLQDYRGYTPINGDQGVAIDAVGILLIPARGGTIKVVPGEYAVLEHGGVAKFTAKEFDEAFQVAEQIEAEAPPTA